MIHVRQSVRRGTVAQPRGGFAALLAGVLLAGGCGNGHPVDPGDLRFAQRGHVEVRLEVPLRLGEGRLAQELRWRSDGTWTLQETISYRGSVGDATVWRSNADASPYVLAYDGLVRKLNEEPAEQLFTPDLPTALVPECGPTQTRVTLTLRDDARDESATWIRCVEGSMNTLTPQGAGPDPAASRVALAAILVRQSTVGERWISAYLGSVPFGTLDRGGDSRSALAAPVTFIDAAGFNEFWGRHAPGRAPPTVDFTRDMVVAAVVGVRREAGDSVEVRRILQVAEGSLAEVYERVPGDYCSPAARTHVPFHVVVAPRTPVPHRFADVKVERVSCGG